MTNPEEAPDEYAVGYCNPPRHSQFRPGQSGNPKGRPKGRPNLRLLLEKRLYQLTRVKVDGEVRNITILEAGVMRLVQAMVQGPPSKVISVMRFVSPLISADNSPESVYDLSKLSDDELEMFTEFVARIQVP